MSEHDWLNTEQAARMFSDHWRLRALKYEQALREIAYMAAIRPALASSANQRLAEIGHQIHRILDKLGTPAENSANEVENPDWGSAYEQALKTFES